MTRVSSVVSPNYDNSICQKRAHLPIAATRNGMLHAWKPVIDQHEFTAINAELEHMTQLGLKVSNSLTMIKGCLEQDLLSIMVRSASIYQNLNETLP